MGVKCILDTPCAGFSPRKMAGNLDLTHQSLVGDRAWRFGGQKVGFMLRLIRDVRPDHPL
eukprot:1153363-Pelagomonas_calceolata.AAC.8